MGYDHATASLPRQLPLFSEFAGTGKDSAFMAPYRASRTIEDSAINIGES